MQAMTEHSCPTPGPNDQYPTRRASEPALLYRTDPVVYGNADGPIDQETLVAYEADGFLTVDELLAPEEVERYRAELRRLADDEAVLRDDRTVTERGSD